MVLFSACSQLMTSSGPGCPATAFEGAKRRANAFVARRVEKHVYILFDWKATPDLSRALRREKSIWWSFLRKCARLGSIFGGIDSHAWRSRATHKHVSGFPPHFLYSRELYRSSQEQFSSARRAQRKFRMEPGRSAAKLALCWEIFLQQIA